MAPAWHTSLTPYLGRTLKLGEGMQCIKAAEPRWGRTSPSTDTRLRGSQNQRVGKMGRGVACSDVKDSREGLFVSVWLP